MNFIKIEKNGLILIRATLTPVPVDRSRSPKMHCIHLCESTSMRHKQRDGDILQYI